MPARIVFDDQTTFLTDPVSPKADETFTISWREINIGDEPSDAYTDTINFDDRGSGDSQDVECESLDSGDTIMRSAFFALPSGNYNMSLTISSFGTYFLGNIIID
jgi:hypothetical protein